MENFTYFSHVVTCFLKFHRHVKRTVVDDMVRFVVINAELDNIYNLKTLCLKNGKHLFTVAETANAYLFKISS